MIRNKRLEREKKTLKVMIELYCKAHHNAKELCSDCTSLLEFAFHKLDKCPFGNEKPTCLECTIHCFRKEQKEKIREIMRYSGPRMLTKHPFYAIMHILDKKRK